MISDAYNPSCHTPLKFLTLFFFNFFFRVSLTLLLIPHSTFFLLRAFFFFLNNIYFYNSHRHFSIQSIFHNVRIPTQEYILSTQLCTYRYNEKTKQKIIMNKIKNKNQTSKYVPPLLFFSKIKKEYYFKYKLYINPTLFRKFLLLCQ